VLSIVAAYALLRLSPRGRNVLKMTSGASVFVIVLAWAGVQLVSDLNRHLDASASVAIQRTVTGRTRRARRYGTSYDLALSPEQAQSPVKIGTSLRVSEADYLRSFQHTDIVVHVKRGWLGFPWYESIEFGHASGDPN
jgi:hypothetical protein